MDNTFVVSARKYRPQTFDSVVGQKSITQTLKNAIRTNQLAHAYLFCGPRGVGKTTCARIFAKTINCQNLTHEIEACDECPSCKAFNTNRSMNIHELDAASNNSVEDIRKLIDQVRIPPQIGKYSVYIIDEVHMLSQSAFNAFLKTLEEPPSHAIFILATTEKHKILPTILSRCQIYDFQRIKVSDISEHLLNIAKKEKIDAEPEAVNIIAQKADGGLRDALSFFDQIASFSNKQIKYKNVIESLNVLDYDYYFSLTDNFINGNYQNALLTLDEILYKGFDTQNFIVGLAGHMRDLLVSQDAETIKLMEVSDGIKQKYFEQSKITKPLFLLKAIEIISKTDVEHKMSQNKRLHVELMLLQLSQINEELAKKLLAMSVQSNMQTVNTNVQQNNTQQQNTINNIQQTKVTEQNLQTHRIKKEETKTIEQNKLNTTSSNSIPSISSLLNGINTTNNNKVTEPKKEYVKGNNLPSLDEIQVVWLEFAESFKTNQPRLHALFTDYKLTMNGQTLQLLVFNQDQKEKIDNLRFDLLNFINGKLNSNVSLEINISETASTKKVAYTNEEKYNYLKEINPKLDDLSNQFKLTFG